jgi:hypothetical protein
LSALKIMNPQKSYRQLFREYVAGSESRLPADTPAAFRKGLSVAMAILAPRGLLIRTSQIVGSFIILNGTINALQAQFSAQRPVKSNPDGIDTTVLTDPRAEVASFFNSLLFAVG